MATQKKQQVAEDSQNNDGAEDDHMFEEAGLECITKCLHELYPDQKNHLQATAVVKFWLGGPDPLDYISMLYNPGDSNQGIPPHWHYVSFGFSDLHGDGRVHQLTGANQQSGFGFELTFRLKKEERENSPPMWPASLMNSLARYVFQTGNVLSCGDHIPWNRSLDHTSQSQIQNMLITEDPQLKPQETPYGTFEFRQVVGVTEEEVKAAQRWKGNGILDILGKVPEASGPWFVTDMKRHKSVFDVDPHLKQTVAESIDREGSNLGHVTVVCGWDDGSDSSKENNANNGNKPEKSEQEAEEERDLDFVNLKLDLEAAELLPLVVRGRLQKGRYFVFQNVSGQVIVLVPPEAQGEVGSVDENHPLKAQGPSLQVYCCKAMIANMARELAILQRPQELRNYLPKVIGVGPPNIEVTVYPVGQLN